MKTKCLFVLLMGLTFQIAAAQVKRPVASPGELRCLGFIHDSELPLDLFVSGTEEEGRKTAASEGALIYVSGPGIQSLKVGESLQAVRIQGKVRDPLAKKPLGVYYKEVGTARIEALRGQNAVARIVMGCDVVYKGDLLVRIPAKTPVMQPAGLSSTLTPPTTTGVATSIVLGKDDTKLMAAGDICFIGVGQESGIKAGDRFTIYRVQPRFDSKELIVNQSHSYTSYQRQTVREQGKLVKELKKRTLPHQVIGDLVVIHVSPTASTAMIVNSQSEILLGDLVIKQ